MSDSPRLLPLLRQLRMIRLLAASAEGHSMDELAEELNVGRRTAQRMVSALTELFPIETVDEGCRTPRYKITAGLDPSILAPKAEELANLDLAAHMFKERGEASRAKSLLNLQERMLASLRQTQRRRLQPDIEALAEAQIPVATPGPQVAVDQAVLDTCQMALMAGMQLGFVYTPPHGKATRRVVAPRGLLIGTRSYLVAAVKSRGKPVLFRLDRMDRATLEDTVAWLDPEFDLNEFRDQSFGVFQEDRYPIHLVFDASVADDAATYRFHPNQSSCRLVDGCLSVQFSSGGILELVWHLITWGPTFRIESPPELKACLRDQLTGLLKRLDQET